MAAKSKLKGTALQVQLEEYGADLMTLTKIKPQQFDIVRVATMINATPQRKWNAAQAVVTYTVAKKEAENALKAIRATKMLEANHASKKTRLSNADDRRAFVDNDPKVQEAEINVINAEAQLVAAKLGYECLDDLFTAGKKVMDWLTEQERATKQYDKFVNEGARHR